MWGHTQSCGCLQREQIRNLGFAKRKPPGESSFNQLYVTYVNRATRDSIEFRLSKDEFKKLTGSDCFYCGTKPAASIGTKRMNGTYIHNGIDRVNNDAGYIVQNCVPCCTQCNMAKHMTKLPEFLDWVKRVHAHLLIKGLI